MSLSLSFSFSFSTLLSCKHASHHNCVRLFLCAQKWSEHGVCFGNVYFQMSFAPQSRALFQHLNFQKCSDNQVLLAFFLQNVLRATTACNFSSLRWTDGSTPATLASLLFEPPEPQHINTLEKQCFATFLSFRAPGSSFFWLFSSLIFFLLPFSSLVLPTSTASSVPTVGSLTSKLPCAKNFPQYYFVLRSLHWILSGTTSYYEAAQILPSTTQITSQYYFALQSLQKALPNTKLY